MLIHNKNLRKESSNNFVIMSTSSQTTSRTNLYDNVIIHHHIHHHHHHHPMSNHTIVTNQINTIAQSIIDLCNKNGFHFDHSIRLRKDDIITINELKPLLSISLLSDDNQRIDMPFNHSWLPLLHDMQDMIQIMVDKTKQLLSDDVTSSSSSSSLTSSSSPASSSSSVTTTITCRLAIIYGVRCPKWHEDNVYMRLIKSYYGPGTDWVDPSYSIVRVENYIRRLCDVDLTVRYPMWIQHANCMDILIINGKKREMKQHGIKQQWMKQNGIKQQWMKPHGIKGYQSLPVLHRSPLVDESSRRLLYTVTIDIEES